jgi:hypothetical protein
LRKSVIPWLAAVLLIIGLYTIGPALGFNRASPLIFGMPPLIFWFVLVPLLNPLILGALYLIDQAGAETSAAALEE